MLDWLKVETHRCNCNETCPMPLTNRPSFPAAVVIAAGGWLAVPLNQVAAPIWVKPVTLPRDSFRFSCRPVGWAHVTQPGAVASETIACLPITR